MDAASLYAAIAAVCPVLGLDLADPTDRSTWGIRFAEAASADQRAAAQTVLSACREDTKAPTPPRAASGRQLRYALNAEGWRQAWDASVVASKKPNDLDYWQTLGSGDLAPETNPKLARIAAAASPPIDLKALYDAALV